MSDWNQPPGTPQGFDRYDVSVRCECGYIATIPVEDDLSVGACEWLEVPWCEECDKEIETDDCWRA